MFSTLPNANFNFWVKIILSSANALNLDESKILSFSKELRDHCADTTQLLYPFLNTPSWDRPKFKEAADDKWNVAIKGFYDTDCIENIVEKGDIAHLSNFTFFHNVFLKLFFFNVLKWVFVEERIKSTQYNLHLNTTCWKRPFLLLPMGGLWIQVLL